MVRHTPLQRNPKDYEDYFCHQAGYGIPVFVGGRSQKGHGLGSFFGGLGRMVLPWLKTGGKALLKEGLGTGLQIAQDALSGRNFGESMRDRAKAAGQRLLHGAVNHLNQSGSGVRRRRLAAPPGEPVRNKIKRATSPTRVQSAAKKQRRSQDRQHSDIFS